MLSAVPAPCPRPHTRGTPGSSRAPAAGLPAQPDLGAARDLEALREAFTPGAPHFRFQHLLLNVVPAPGARAKPPGVDELRWREALQVPARKVERNPNPERYVGFQEQEAQRPAAAPLAVGQAAALARWEDLGRPVATAPLRAAGQELGASARRTRTGAY